jgi:putative ABC transport system permease protein
MNLVQTFPLAARALVRNKTRSLLTALGVVIGVASVISMVAVGEGAKARVEGVFATMGTNMLIVVSGSTSSGGVMGGFGSMPTLTWDDLHAIRTQAHAVRLAAPSMTARVTLLGDDANWTTSVIGTTPDYFEVRAWHAAQGSLFSSDDVNAVSRVLVLGRTAADKLFGPDVNPIGRTLRLRSSPFLVIGVLDRKGQSPMGSDYDDISLVPHTAFQTKIQGGLQKFIPGAILVSAIAANATMRAQHEMTAILRDTHHLASDTEDDFSIRNLSEIAAAQQQGTKALTGLLAAIAVVSLIVGGIGIMNIMLVSVTERTREIGLRMALGAKPWHVLAQFLVEAMALSMAGGLLGIAFGMVAARAVASRFAWPFAPRIDMVVLAFGFSVLVGIAFGFYPARKAARLDPIEALRYE